MNGASSTKNFPPCRSSKKLRKPNRRPRSETPTQKLRKPNAKEIISIARAQQNHHLSATTALTKNGESPTGNLESPNTTTSCPSPTRNKIINRASSSKHFPLRHSNKQKTTKAQQQTPKAQLTPTQKCNRAGLTNCVPATTAPTKTAKTQQGASKVQLQQKNCASSTRN